MIKHGAQKKGEPKPPLIENMLSPVLSTFVNHREYHQRNYQREPIHNINDEGKSNNKPAPVNHANELENDEGNSEKGSKELHDDIS
jgi:hypothetical protein